MNSYLALTIIADDRPGIIDKIAEPIKQLGGNWLESSMSHLAGKFAGILLVSIPETQTEPLTSQLQKLESHGIKIVVETATPQAEANAQQVTLNVVANDRPGIIGELSALFAKNHVNVVELNTSCESAPMSADPLFKANATVVLPNNLSEQDLTELLEALSDDLVVETD